MTELEAVQTTQVKIRLAGDTVIAWPRGDRIVSIPDAEGFHRFHLPPGEGIFLEVR
jgi:hypothetical protein